MIEVYLWGVLGWFTYRVFLDDWLAFKMWGPGHPIKEARWSWKNPWEYVGVFLWPLWLSILVLLTVWRYWPRSKPWPGEPPEGGES